MIYLMPKPSQSFFAYCIQSQENFLTEKELYKEEGVEDWTKKKKEGFLTALTTTIKKDPTTSIRKHPRELKAHKKTVMTAIKQDLSPNLNPLDYAIWDILENKTNVNSHQNIGSFKTVIEEEWNKMSEEFILKAYKLFQRGVDTVIEKNGGHIE